MELNELYQQSNILIERIKKDDVHSDSFKQLSRDFYQNVALNLNMTCAFISKEEVLSKNFKPLERHLKKLNKKGMKAADKNFTIFDGWDDTADELFEIKPVRDFINEFLMKHPEYLYYENENLGCPSVFLISLANKVQSSLKTEDKLNSQEWILREEETGESRKPLSYFVEIEGSTISMVMLAFQQKMEEHNTYAQFHSKFERFFNI